MENFVLLALFWPFWTTAPLCCFRPPLLHLYFLLNAFMTPTNDKSTPLIREHIRTPENGDRMLGSKKKSILKCRGCPDLLKDEF